MKETGIISREDKIWNKKNLKCSDAVKYVEIGLTETLFTFKMYIFGFVFSMIILLLELMYYKMTVIVKNLTNWPKIPLYKWVTVQDLN